MHMYSLTVIINVLNIRNNTEQSFILMETNYNIQYKCTCVCTF